jgi:23S rRNA pseudouridine2605 synthase
LNKPTGVLCTSDDPGGRTTFLSLLPKDLPRVYTVGRLDRDSEGLLLVTNDGELANRLMHPRYEVHKTYHVWVDRELTSDEVQRAKEGVWDEGERLSVLSIRKAPSPRQAVKYEMVLGEGRNRHIRRLMEAMRVRVTRLRRVRLGPLHLNDLREGAYRALTPAEIGALQQDKIPGDVSGSIRLRSKTG